MQINNQKRFYETIIYFQFIHTPIDYNNVFDTLPIGI